MGSYFGDLHLTQAWKLQNHWAASSVRKNGHDDVSRKITSDWSMDPINQKPKNGAKKSRLNIKNCIGPDFEDPIF